MLLTLAIGGVVLAGMLLAAYFWFGREEGREGKGEGEGVGQLQIPPLSEEDRVESQGYLDLVIKAGHYFDQALRSLPSPERDLLIMTYELHEEGYRLESRNLLFPSRIDLEKAVVHAREDFFERLIEILADSPEASGDMAEIFQILESWLEVDGG